MANELLKLRPQRPRWSRVQATITPNAGMVKPGRITRFELRLQNRFAPYRDVYIDVEPPATGWTAHTRLDKLRLMAGIPLVLYLQVAAPPEATLGERMTFQVRIVADGRVVRKLTAETIVGP